MRILLLIALASLSSLTAQTNGPVTVLPPSGGSVGSFHLEWTGASNIAYVQVAIDRDGRLDPLRNCWIRIGPQGGMSLLADDGVSNAVNWSNSQCSLNDKGSISRITANTLMVDLSLTFTPAYAGERTIQRSYRALTGHGADSPVWEAWGPYVVAAAAKEALTTGAWAGGSEFTNPDGTTLHFGPSFSWETDLANGVYQLDLRFAEPNATAAGQRTFNVSANDQPLLTSFDVFARAGLRKLTTRSFIVVVTEGHLSVRFVGLSGKNAVCSGGSITPISVY